MIRHLLYIFVFSMTAAFIGVKCSDFSFPVPGHHEFNARQLLLQEIASSISRAYIFPGQWLPEKSLLSAVLDPLFWGCLFYGLFCSRQVALDKVRRRWHQSNQSQL
jgi:hypothetical protein